jgi:hypothetical protein
MAIRRVGICLLFLFAVSVTMTSQEPLLPGPGTNVKLERGAAPPDGKTSVPLTLTPTAGTNVSELEIVLSFPKALISYVSNETSAASDDVGAVVKASVRASDSDPLLSQLTLTIVTPPRKTPRTALPKGTLVYLLFHVSKDAKLGTNIPFQITGKATTADNKPVEPLTIQAAKFGVSEAPITGCFFYMH